MQILVTLLLFLYVTTRDELMGKANWMSKRLEITNRPPYRDKSQNWT